MIVCLLLSLIYQMKSLIFNLQLLIKIFRMNRRRRRQNSEAKCCISIVIFVAMSIYSFYEMYTEFPDHLRHLEPVDWKSHSSPDLDQHVRDLTDVKPRIINDTSINICKDLEIDSNQNIYCVNQFNQIIKHNVKNSKSQKLFTILKGTTYGIRLSKDEKYLYLVNSVMGLCEFNIKKNKITELEAYYQGQFLMSLNGIEIHPQDSNLIYVTQSSRYVQLEKFNIDLFLGNPFGRLFQYDKKKQRLSLIADELHFPNGIVFQKYEKQDTLLVAETSRFRVTRIYLNEEKKGQKEIAINQLNIYPDNMKFNDKGQLLIGAMGIKYPMMNYIGQSYIGRLFYSRTSLTQYSKYAGSQEFGGIKVKMSRKKNKKHKIEYLLWNDFKNYDIVSTLIQKNGNLYISSFEDQGVIVIQDYVTKLKSTQKNKKDRNNRKHYLISNVTGYYEGRKSKLQNAFNWIGSWFQSDDNGQEQ